VFGRGQFDTGFEGSTRLIQKLIKRERAGQRPGNEKDTRASQGHL
jgi:hypothetical protein